MDFEISEEDFPALYQSADRNSLKSQTMFVRATRIRLALLVAAALFGGFTWLWNGADLAGVFAAVAFGGALITELYLLKARPERVWYDGRAAAESAKTLTWRYLVGGAPFGTSGNTLQEVDDLFLQRLRQIAHDLPGLHLVPIADSTSQITAAMRRVRAWPLEQRRDLYRRGRIQDQANWYSSKARWNTRRATVWAVAMAVVEGLGLVGAVLKATNLLDVDLLGLAGALVAAGVAWVQTKQHGTLARAYAVAAQELGDISSRIEGPNTDDEWGPFVDQAEEAISREHTLWRASHS
jgi:hypothetical protein